MVVDSSPRSECVAEGEVLRSMEPKDSYRYLGATGELVKPPLEEFKLDDGEPPKSPAKN